jgi:hypothetical protein
MERQHGNQDKQPLTRKDDCMKAIKLYACCSCPYLSSNRGICYGDSEGKRRFIPENEREDVIFKGFPSVCPLSDYEREDMEDCIRTSGQIVESLKTQLDALRGDYASSLRFIEGLKSDLSTNASMLAKQTDIARGAEIERDEAIRYEKEELMRRLALYSALERIATSLNWFECVAIAEKALESDNRFVNPTIDPLQGKEGA